MSKKKLNLFVGIIFIVLSVVAVFASNGSPSFSSPFKEISPTPQKEEVFQKVQGDSVSSSPNSSQRLERSDESSNEEEIKNGYRVVKVVDGDTFDVDIDGKVERLRMIGIDTPETVDPRKPVQCFGIEASKVAKEILTGQFVDLEFDATQGDRDKYGRLLRFAFLPDGTNYGLFMIGEGYAHEYTYHLPYKYQAEFKQAEVEARNSGKGLWSTSTCSGNK